MSTAPIANLKDWRRLRSRQIATRSGLVVTLRRDVTVMDLAQQGTIPLPLIQKLSTLVNAQGGREADVMAALGDEFNAVLAAVNAAIGSNFTLNDVAVAAAPRILTNDAYAALVEQAGAALGVTGEQVIAWLLADDGEPHLAGLLGEVRRALEGSIAVGELPFDDRIDLFNAAMEDAAPMATFPRAAG